MQQVKIFKSVESEVASLENEVNEWIRANGCRVINVVANIAPQSDALQAGIQGRYAPSDVLLVVLYETEG
ncbi:MAG: hypothetical protein O2955_18985 [Planctomycetota bacterium]|nr:hypothetical protein [Planctomycetota bacterium]MDA1214601.1 hypothetical protein [Planctomycetota bacterium]